MGWAVLVLVMACTACTGQPNEEAGATAPSTTSVPQAEARGSVDTDDGTLPSPFYAWDQDVPRAGALVREEPLPGHLHLPGAAVNQRILYSSTGSNGLGIVVSGAYFVPDGRPPKGGWPVLAWAHGTVGIADRCAPSWNGRSARDVQYLQSWLREGYAIVATDYQGLGTSGTHLYKHLVSEARSVIDAVRAAVAAHDDLSPRWAVIGQSQGGGAALGTGAVEAGYGDDDLSFLGVVATGPSARGGVVLLRSRDEHPSPLLGFVPLMLRSLEGLEANFDVNAYLTDRGRELLARADTQCYSEIVDWVTSAGVTSRDALVGEAPDPVPLGQKHFDPPATGYARPVLIAQGEADTTVFPGITDGLAREMCAAGVRLRYLKYPGETHSGTMARSLADTVPWMRSLVADGPPPSNCQR